MNENHQRMMKVKDKVRWGERVINEGDENEKNLKTRNKKTK